jgi:hypothetical protein
VEDAIATDSFNETTFPFFARNESDFDREEFIQLGLAQPRDFITFTKIAPATGDDVKTNLINYQGLQFRCRYVDVWGRTSDYGKISDMFLNTLGGLCQSSALARGITLTIPAGCSIVDKIEILVRKWDGNVKGLSVETDWYLYDTVDKYQYNLPTDAWYERTFIPALNYNNTNNTIDYPFYNDKQWLPVDVKLTNRNFNPLAITASTVFPLNRSIGMARLRKGFFPLDDTELEKLNFTVDGPENTGCASQTPQRKLTVWAIIFNPSDGVSVSIRPKNGSIVFGNADCYGRENNPFIYGQVLPTNQEGIIGSLAGTPYYQISQQYRYDRVTGKSEYVGVIFDDLGDPGRYVPLQKWEFNVTPGKYKFWVASHQASPADDFQKTSTRFVGLTDISRLGDIITIQREVIVDLCTEDKELIQNPIMIFDMSKAGKGCDIVDRNSAVEGYLYEDEINKLPIEMAAVIDNVHGSFNCNYTDHNGFYWCFTTNYGLEVSLRGYKSCAADQEMAKSDRAFDNGGAHYRFNKLFAYKGLVPYPVGDRYVVKGIIRLCGAGAGIGGALVALEGAGVAVTLEDGSFTIPAHFIGNTENSREAKLIYSQRGSCQLVNCAGDCSYCINDVATISPICIVGTQGEVDKPAVEFSLKNFSKRGPHMGGKYQGGIVVEDWLGRQTFVQTKKKHIFEIPTIQETGIWGFSTIKFDMTGIVFPLSTKRVTFYISENLNEDDYLNWVADKIEYVDNTGNINNVSPSFIRLYYKSLNEYNKQNNFSTTTTWEVIPEGKTLPIAGDEIEIIAKGDGTLFTERIRSLVTYDSAGQYIQIEFKQELAGLTNNSLFRFVRTGKTNNFPFFYELPPMIKVTAGIPAIVTGTLNLKDAYLIYRQIPVPVDVKIPDPNDSTKTITVTQNELRSYPFPFEHHSPSDLWGDHCWNKGRVSTQNPYEKQLFLKTGIDVSGALASSGILNNLNFIDEAKQVLFDEQEWGGILAGITEISTLLVICEHDNFIVAFDDNRVYTNSDGTIQTISGSKQFGRPDRKIGSNYGCQMWDINTITKEKGKVVYIDSSEAALVVHNFSAAMDISDEAGIKGWLTSKIKYIASFNSFAGAKKYFHSVIDPKTKKYFLSDSRQNIYSSLEKEFDDNVSAGKYAFSLSGIPTAGDIVNVDFHIDLDTDGVQDFSISSTVISGWGLTELLADLLNKIKANNPNTYPYADVDGNFGVQTVGLTAASGLVTVSKSADQTLNNYINDLPDVDVTQGETMIFDVDLKQFWGAAAFVPEGYGTLRGDQADQQLIAFKSGVGWYHHDYRSTATDYLNFFGVQTTPRIKFAFNINPRDMKWWQYLEVYVTGVLLYSNDVRTSTNQLSRIMPKWWQRINKKLITADFKCNINTQPDPNMVKQTSQPNVILDGDVLISEWITVQLLPRASELNKYFELLSAIAYSLGNKIDPAE